MESRLTTYLLTVWLWASDSISPGKKVGVVIVRTSSPNPWIQKPSLRWLEPERRAKLQSPGWSRLQERLLPGLSALRLLLSLG